MSAVNEVRSIRLDTIRTDNRFSVVVRTKLFSRICLSVLKLSLRSLWIVYVRVTMNVALSNVEYSAKFTIFLIRINQT
jgi:hypothetical protein